MWTIRENGHKFNQQSSSDEICPVDGPPLCHYEHNSHKSWILWSLSNACPIKSQLPEKTESKEGKKDMDISPNACEYYFIDFKVIQ